MSKSKLPAVRRVAAGFSLVEVALALGIIAIAVVVVVGLLPSGLTTFRDAMSTSVGGQIAQQLLSEVQQTDFDVLTKASTTPGTNGTFTKPDRYFDEQGTEIVPATTGALSDEEKQKISYWVRVRVSPQTDLPRVGPGNPEITNSDMIATVTIQIASNPSNQPLALETGGASDSNYPLRNLWSGAYASDTSRKLVKNTIYSTLVSRNK